MYRNGDRIPGKSHVYYFNGFHYPSATTILHKMIPEDPALRRWKQTYRDPVFKSAKEYTDYSAIRGTFAHFNILSSISPFQLDAGDLPELRKWRHWQERLLEDVRCCRKLWDMIDIEIIPPTNIEEPMCHHGKWYAGTPDLRGKVKYDGQTKYALVDIKTSKRPYDSHYNQIGAYAQMINDGVSKHRVEIGLLVYVSPGAKKPTVVVIEPGEIQDNICIFNDYRDEFYELPGIVEEYGLLLPQ